MRVGTSNVWIGHSWCATQLSSPPSPSISRKRSVVVLARFDDPLPLPRPRPRLGTGVDEGVPKLSAVETGVAAPEGFALISSKFPSPVVEKKVSILSSIKKKEKKKKNGELRHTFVIHVVKCKILLSLLRRLLASFASAKHLTAV